MRNELLLNFNTLKNNYNELRSLCNSYEREIRELKNKIKEHAVLTNNKINEATKGDIFGIIDYLHNGLADYINNPAGRPYDDDEIININTWVQRCCVWLNQRIKEMS
mgnify:CR=1 FL=1